MEINPEKVAKIKEVLRSFKGENEWCVACGAGAKVARDFVEIVERQTLASITSKEIIDSVLPAIKEVGAPLDAAWCVACGAGAKRIPIEEQVAVRGESVEAATKVITSILKGT